MSILSPPPPPKKWLDIPGGRGGQKVLERYEVFLKFLEGWGSQKKKNPAVKGGMDILWNHKM